MLRPVEIRFLLLLGLACLPAALGVTGTPLTAGEPVEPPAEVQEPAKAQLPLNLQLVEPATSSKQARDEAVASLPIDELEDHHRERVEALLSGPCLFRRVPALRMEIAPGTYSYFRQHPDVAVAIWRALGISRMQLVRERPDHFQVTSEDGSTGTFDILSRSTSQIVVLGSGSWVSPLLPGPIHGEGLLVVRHRLETDKEGRLFVMHQAVVFLSFPQQSVRAVARLLSPLTNMAADRNFQDISAFLRMINLAMVKQPGWVEHVTGRLDSIDAPRRQLLLKTAARVYVADFRRRTPGSLRPDEAKRQFQKRLREVTRRVTQPRKSQR